MDYTFAIIFMALVFLFYYSNQTLMNKIGKPRGSINVASKGENSIWVPSGRALGSMTFREGSRSVLGASYA
jgi:hypothetical protein